MKLGIPVILLGAWALQPLVAAAEQGHGGHAGMMPAGAMAAADMKSAELAEGTVKKIDRAAGKITLQHGPLANLGMPAMTMVFRVKDATWLDQVKEGEKVRFLAERVNGALTVTQLETL